MRVNGSTLVSGNVTVAGHRTSVRLEPEMWDALHEICAREGLTLHQFCTRVDAARRRAAAVSGRLGAAFRADSLGDAGLPSLTAALRVQIMAYFRAAATEAGHAIAGHGAGAPAAAAASLRQGPVYQSG